VIILAAIVLFAINATDWLQQKVSEDVGAFAPHRPASVLVAETRGV
jgi:hypothetical protein